MLQFADRAKPFRAVEASDFPARSRASARPIEDQVLPLPVSGFGDGLFLSIAIAVGSALPDLPSL